MTANNKADPKAKARKGNPAKPGDEVSAKDLDKVTGGAAGLPTGKRMLTSADPCEGGR
jgi:hypothetical protein